MFVGSLRENLDPFEQASDREVRAALERVRLAAGRETGASRGLT
jgi:ABC-type multidrug transport system fused ATPase/permease subunit